MLRFSKSYSLPTTGFLFLFLLGFDCALCMVWCNVFISGCSSFLPLFFPLGFKGGVRFYLEFVSFLVLFFQFFWGGEGNGETNGGGGAQTRYLYHTLVTLNAYTQARSCTKKEKPK